MKIAQYIPPRINCFHPEGGWFELKGSDEFIKDLFDRIEFVGWDKGIRKVLVEDDVDVKTLEIPTI